MIDDLIVQLLLCSRLICHSTYEKLVAENLRKGGVEPRITNF